MDYATEEHDGKSEGAESSRKSTSCRVWCAGLSARTHLVEVQLCVSPAISLDLLFQEPLEAPRLPRQRAPVAH